MIYFTLANLSVKDKANQFFLNHGIEISNVIINEILDVYHLHDDKEKEINFWLDVKNELIILYNESKRNSFKINTTINK